MRDPHRLRCLASLVPLAILAFCPAFAQTQGGGTTGGSKTGSASPPKTTTPAPSKTTVERGTSTSTRQTYNPPMFVEGKVVFEDGTPAPPDVPIECAGSRMVQARTNIKGEFSFEIGGGSAAGNSAADGGFNSPWSLSRNKPDQSSSRLSVNCRLQANLPGYQSTKLSLAGHRPLGGSDVGTIILTKLENVRGNTISVTTLHAPKKARKAFDNGVKNALAKNFEKAEEALKKAVEIYPEYSEAWFHLGQVREERNNPAGARQAYRQSVGADSKLASPYLRLAMMDTYEADWPAVAQATEQVIKMNPHDFPDAFYLNAVAYLNLNQMDQAEKSAREAIRMNAWQNYPQVEQILGVALAHQNKYAEARTHLARYLELSPDAVNAAAVKEQLTQVESLLAAQTPAAGQSDRH